MSHPSDHRDPADAHGVQQGMVLMVVAMLILPGIDAIAKALSATVPPGQVAWSRFLFQTLLLAPLVLGRGRVRLGREIWVHALRGFLIALVTVLFFTSLAVLPLADAISIFFVEPLLLTLLAALFLGERISWRRLLAIAFGFAGALIVVRPSYQAFGWTALLPIGAALAFACYLIATRWLVRREDAVTMQFHAGVFGCLIMSLALWAGSAAGIATFDPVRPTALEWGLLAGLGMIATVGHVLIVLAFRRAPAGTLAPFQYLEIIGATLLGLVIFGNFPDAMTWLGIAMIVGAGLFVFHRERKLARAAGTEAGGV